MEQNILILYKNLILVYLYPGQKQDAWCIYISPNYTYISKLLSPLLHSGQYLETFHFLSTLDSEFLVSTK